MPRALARTQTSGLVAYGELKRRVKAAFLEGQSRIEEAKVLTYWETGRLINEYLGKSANSYQTRGQQVVSRLARDMDIGEKVFYRCMRFAETFPNFSARRNLSWAHYRALLTISDEEKRKDLIEKTERGEWSSRELEIKVRNLNWDKRVQKSGGEAPVLHETPRLGKLYTYRILQPPLVQGEPSELLIDLGFSVTKDLDSVTSRALKAGDFVESSKTGEDYALKKSTRQESDLYTYAAEIEKVVDGDTLRVIVDLGFGIKTRQYLRLRGLDAPEVDTKEGVAAVEFVKSRLKRSDQILIKSSKSDKYDRYLADIFYRDKSGNEQYLNNEILINHYAVRIRD